MHVQHAAEGEATFWIDPTVDSSRRTAKDWELLQSAGLRSRSIPSVDVMAHPIHRVSRFSVVAPYTLQVSFTDGTDQRIDFLPVLLGPMFGGLQDLRTFNAVVVDPEAGTLVWPNGADFDPATLHACPSVGTNSRCGRRTGQLRTAGRRAKHRLAAVSGRERMCRCG